MLKEINEIEYSEKFLKQSLRLPRHIKEIAKEKEIIFRNDVFDQRLGTHKLHGKDKKVWAFWITNSYRIKFVFLNGDKVLFLEVGTHKIYKQR